MGIGAREGALFLGRLKFFNVYGPNEYHKRRMASVIYHAFNQIKADGGMKLFRSHDVPTKTAGSCVILCM
jgi:ADP-L-glycero-D-manno-heptose 6-epimerase